MFRLAIASLLTAIVFLTVQLLTLKALFGQERGRGFHRGGSSNSSSRSFGGDSNRSSRSFSSRSSDSGGSDRSFQSRGLQSDRSSSRTEFRSQGQSRSFDLPGSTRLNRTFERQPGNRSSDAPTFRRGSSTIDQPGNESSRNFIRRDESLAPPRSSSRPYGGNDAAAEAIRRARSRVLSGDDSETRLPRSTRVERNPTIGSDEKPRVTIGRDQRFDSPQKSDNVLNRLPKQARDAIDRTNIKRDLKLGDRTPGPRTKDADASISITPRRLNRDDLRLAPDKDRGPEKVTRFKPSTTLDRKRALENRLGIDNSNREKYDLLHRRIKHTGRFDDDAKKQLARKSWVEKTDRDHFIKLAKSEKFSKLKLDDQFRLHDRGDIARRLRLTDDFHRRGGWQHRHVGFVSSFYRNHCTYRTYWGPSWYPRRCWYPIWNSWVNWSWTFHCDPWYDPRPIFCRPVIYDPCPTWVYWQYPVWQPLPYVAAGTWVDVPQVAINNGWDVQLLAVRFVDPGHFEQNLGPRYRVWLRNNSNVDIDKPFNVIVMGTNELVPNDRRLEAGQRVPSIAAGQTLAVDIRLPIAPQAQAGEPFDFSNVHVLVDAHRELNDIDLTNNGAVVDRGDVMPVDPTAFQADSDLVEPGMVINIAGEGLGPEPGQVMLQVDGQTYQPEILGWYDLGVQLRVPAVVGAGIETGDLLIVRGDGAAANPLTLQIAAAPEVGRAF